MGKEAFSWTMLSSENGSAKRKYSNEERNLETHHSPTKCSPPIPPDSQTACSFQERFSYIGSDFHPELVQEDKWNLWEQR